MSDVVLVRYWAAAKAAAGRPEEELPAVATLAELLDALRERYGAGSQLDVVLGRCSYLVDEVSPGTRNPAEVPLAPGAVVDVLPPFAGGAGTPADGPRLVHP
ncbi:MAG: MoaD/ThiS family protein [Candidatus Nanopelagicales bacterium]